jgi:hypothetical protein
MLLLVDHFLDKRDSLPAYFLFDNQNKLRTFSHEQNGLEIIEDELDQLITELRAKQPFCPECQLFLNEDAMFCSDCGLPLTLPGGAHPYYEHHHSASLPTVRLLDPDPLIGITIDAMSPATHAPASRCGLFLSRAGPCAPSGAADSLEAAGALRVTKADVTAQTSSVHLLGTCRMGNDPATSVIDKYHRSHDVRNLFICDGSSFVTSGRGQPTMTIQALAFRAGEHIARFAKRGEV